MGISFKKTFLLIIIVIALPVAVYLVGQRTGFFKKASGVPANLVVDLGTSYAVAGEGWRNLAQGGEEKGRMLLPVLEQTKALRPRYIRIDHIYDQYDVVTGSSGNLAFNWAQLDLTLSDIAALGAKPFIALSYLPPVISKSDIVGDPVSWADWETVVQKTVEHISGSLGIDGVYYEVWNEPDLFGKYKISGEKSYLNLYGHSIAGAQRAKGVKSFRIGGPAVTAFYDNWFTGLLNFCSQNNVRIDFYSWHRYSKNLDVFEDDFLRAKKLLVDYPQYKNIELIISEMGPNSENDPVYDNSFGAIHTIATLALLENDVRKGFSFEIKDGPGAKQYWGRWGIFTHEKFGAPVAKPRANAFYFLNKMTGEKINVAGEGSWVKAFAKKDNATFKILLVNYDPSGKHYEAVPLSLTNLPYKNFSFKRVNFGGGGNDLLVATDSATWKTTVELNANTAAIFEITPK